MNENIGNQHPWDRTFKNCITLHSLKGSCERRRCKCGKTGKGLTQKLHTLKNWTFDKIVDLNSLQISGIAHFPPSLRSTETYFLLKALWGHLRFFMQNIYRSWASSRTTRLKATHGGWFRRVSQSHCIKTSKMYTKNMNSLPARAWRDTRPIDIMKAPTPASIYAQPTDAK